MEDKGGTNCGKDKGKDCREILQQSGVVRQNVSTRSLKRFKIEAINLNRLNI
ncbi:MULTISPECIES: hypothetical protein [unclassified Rhizobium]|uniref:hypothetical protein n=1 Tax=unclassified Rhizobium TaxID=2613769 RepID=UPI001A99DDFD|nr:MULTISPECIES: hypothetical protein [unclassified Rhizobium]MBX5158087.1 hypothetical protein [Rhizobium sp. NZLR8]MBX5163397.1 hypothetical protein [Rhizobium sp. NZLR4b]MBX5169166.1 hypothetical protein [Rhizobium sp. NZLR1b]MBX5182735.1 hypothetical protein [Rhizobium sp. NZLR5]MBX5189700.1 hypothetical protein [Rhizobium sp. NZLR3b]